MEKRDGETKSEKRGIGVFYVCEVRKLLVTGSCTVVGRIEFPASLLGRGCNHQQ